MKSRNAAITQRNEALAAATDSGSLPAVPPELDPINEYASFLQNPVSLRDLVHDSYPRPKQGEEVRDDFAARLELDMEALNKFAGMAWVGGGGAIGDFGNNTRDWMLLEAFIKGGKPVAGICYGSIVLAQVKDFTNRRVSPARSFRNWSRRRRQLHGGYGNNEPGWDLQSIHKWCCPDQPQ